MKEFSPDCSPASLKIAVQLSMHNLANLVFYNGLAIFNDEVASASKDRSLQLLVLRFTSGKRRCDDYNFVSKSSTLNGERVAHTGVTIWRRLRIRAA